MNKLLAGLLAVIGLLSFAGATGLIELGMNKLELASFDSTTAAGETLFCQITQLLERPEMQGVMYLTYDWVRIGSCSTGTKFGVYEGNVINEWDYNTVLCNPRGAATGDTTFEVNLAPCYYQKWWILCDDSADSVRINRAIELYVR